MRDFRAEFEPKYLGKHKPNKAFHGIGDDCFYEDVVREDWVEELLLYCEGLVEENLNLLEERDHWVSMYQGIEKQLEELQKELETLKWEKDVGEKFHKVTLSEKELEIHRVNKLTKERDELKLNQDMIVQDCIDLMNERDEARKEVLYEKGKVQVLQEIIRLDKERFSLDEIEEKCNKITGEDGIIYFEDLERELKSEDEEPISIEEEYDVVCNICESPNLEWLEEIQWAPAHFSSRLRCKDCGHEGIMSRLKRKEEYPQPGLKALFGEEEEKE